MTVSASRVRNRSTGSVPDTPGFRRRHGVLALLLAAHLPALAAIAVLTGQTAQDVLVEAAVVLVAIAVGVFLDLSPRLRTVALALGLLWCSVVVGLLTASAVAGALHAALVGLLAAGHLGASWRSLPATTDVEHVDLLAEPAPVDAGQAAAGPEAVEDDDLVEVREIYTGVWSANRLVRPRTRLLRLPERAPQDTQVEAVSPAPAATSHVAPTGDPAEPLADLDGPAVAPAPVEAPAPADSRDPDLTREVLEALHLSSIEPTTTGRAREHATTGPGGS